MDIHTEVDKIVTALPATVDPGVAEYLRELVAVGEDDIAVVSLVELAPQAVDGQFVDQLEEHYRGSGAYVEPQALAAVTKYRQLSPA
jgi:hypothetical protein